MKYFEFGQEHPELMVMLHGGGVSEGPSRIPGRGGIPQKSLIKKGRNRR